MTSPMNKAVRAEGTDIEINVLIDTQHASDRTVVGIDGAGCHNPE